MTIEKQDAALLDVVSAYCALNNVTAKDLVHLSFGEILKRFASLCQLHPKWVWASREIRKHYHICHQGCHIDRIQTFMKADGDWPADNVIEFPTNHTRH